MVRPLKDGKIRSQISLYLDIMLIRAWKEQRPAAILSKFLEDRIMEELAGCRLALGVCPSCSKASRWSDWIKKDGGCPICGAQVVPKKQLIAEPTAKEAY